MATAVPLIRSSLLAEFPALVVELGGNLEEILEEARLSLEQIEQPTLLIPFDKQVRLLQIAAQQCSCEHFALELARRQDMAVFGALSILTVQAGSVGHALQMFGRYLHYSVQAVRLEIREQGGLVFFVVDSPFVIAAGSDQFWDHAVALQCTVIRMVCGDSWAPRSTFLRRAEPREAGPYSRYFRCAVAFGSDFSGLVFPQEVLERPISGAIDAVPQQLQQYLRSTYEGDFLEQVRRVINSLLPTHNCTAASVANCMGYSQRTLQRKLASEQTGFQQQLDKVRSELAISYLQEPLFSLTDITELLGFAESGVFTRSFKRWFGVTPSKWRSRRFA
ncbi:MAG: helix-turn-helix domain-containing protein [Haliea sp.]|jgi:AraC-like DNA-binding protein|nr:helix-turn-helix domain-containing protein [Haliea sp.]